MATTAWAPRRPISVGDGQESMPRSARVPGPADRGAVPDLAVQRCGPTHPDCGCPEEQRAAVGRKPPSVARMLAVQRSAGNRAATALATRVPPVTGRSPVPATARASGERDNTAGIQRYLIEDCDAYPASQRREGVRVALQIARKAKEALRQYAVAKHKGQAVDPRTTLLLRRYFNTSEAVHAMSAAFRYGIIINYLAADDFTIECENDCDDEYAYVYAFWTDVHMCMNKLKNKSDTRFGQILLHEVSHAAASTDDEEYFYYPPTTAGTTLDASDALDNADSYEAFAAEI